MTRRKAVVCLAAAALCATLVEAAGTLLFYAKHRVLPHEYASKNFYAYEHHYMSDHPYLPYLALPGEWSFIRFNSFGDRGPELDSPKRRIRILCYGGSTTFDAAHAWAQTWPGYLQSYLGGEKYEVVIAAQNGATTADTLVNYSLIHSGHSADYLLAYEGNNDLESSYCRNFKTDYSHRRRKIALQTCPIVERLPRWLDYSSVYVAIRAALTAPTGDLWDLYTRPCEIDFAGGPFGLETFRRNLLNIGALAKTNGAKLILGTFQFYKPWADANMPAGFAEAWQRGNVLENEIIRDVARRHPEIGLADVAKSFAPQAAHMIDFCHLTALGNQLIAKAYFEAIKKAEARRPR